MEENVALDTSKQKQFVKSIKGLKKLLKKNEKEEPEITPRGKIKDGKVSKRKRKNRGLVYLSHIPHGFYEHEMTEYFKQFGVVTNVRVIRSRRTGNSKGYAFVEFGQPAVAEIVAETMNNYLMGKRLIKAAYVPPEKQRPKAMRKNWNPACNPGREMRIKMKKAYNANKDREGELKKVKRLLANIKKTKKKLTEMGIDYDFTPVDFPEAMKKFKKETTEETKTEVKEEKKSKKKKKNKKEQKVEVVEEKIKDEDKEKIDVNKPAKKEQNKKANKEPVQEVVVNKKEQKQKQKKLKEAGVTPPENFIKIQQDADSDSSYEFDSDEYDKMLENEDELNSDISGDDDDESGDEVMDNESDVESEVEVPSKKAKTKPLPIVAIPVQSKKKNRAKGKKQNNPKEKIIPKPLPVEIKRKVTEKTAVSPKKQKFEKQSQKQIKKQFKKKK